MSRKEFMEQLERLLMDIPKEEREEALEFYHNYFEDAGVANEENIIRELESPEKVAEVIKADVGVEEEKEYTEKGYTDARFHGQEEVGQHIDGYQEETKYQQAETFTESNYTDADKANEKKDRTLKIALIILAVIVTSPIWGSVLGGIFGIIGGIFGTMIAVAAVVIALYVLGFTIGGVGVSMLAVANMGAGLGLLGIGLVCLAVALLGTITCVWIYGKAFPWVIREIIGLCKRIFKRKGSAV